MNFSEVLLLCTEVLIAILLFVTLMKRRICHVDKAATQAGNRFMSLSEEDSDESDIQIISPKSIENDMGSIPTMMKIMSEIGELRSLLLGIEKRQTELDNLIEDIESQQRTLQDVVLQLAHQQPIIPLEYGISDYFGTDPEEEDQDIICHEVLDYNIGRLDEDSLSDGEFGSPLH
jgi:hypothetical protein